MPWQHVTPMSQRKEFVSLAMVDGANMSRLCRRFEISRKTGYKWLARFAPKEKPAWRTAPVAPGAAPAPHRGS